MPVRQVKEFLDNNNVKYATITHSAAFTAQEIAALTHTKGRDFAKTVVISIDGAMALAVLPASYQVDLNKLRERTGAAVIALASEAEFRSRFPGCETGAMPPFGNLYAMPVFLDESLRHEKDITFNAGSHHELIRMAYEDFKLLVKPQILNFAAGRRAHAA